MSVIYAGTIRHRRFAVRGHEFRHRIALALQDADSARGPSLTSSAVRALVSSQTGVEAPAGPVSVLTMPPRFGVGFNPVSFYYCFDGDGRVGAALAEVTSTPWGERHAYALARTGDGRVLGAGFDKRLHVSPFMAMDQHYELRMTEPGETLSVHIESFEGGRRAFDATLRLERVTRGRATSPLRVLGLIYGHALLLKLKGVRVHPRPEATA